MTRWSDVLEALERDGCLTGEGEGPSNQTVETVLQWVVDNRVPLARFAKEQAARAALGLNEHWTVLFEPGQAPPTRFIATQQSIRVGIDWSPTK